MNNNVILVMINNNVIINILVLINNNIIIDNISNDKW